MDHFKQIENRWRKNYCAHPVIPNKALTTETETAGEFCSHPPTYERKLTFVTLEDVFPGQFEFNYVLFNPGLTKEQNERVLRHAHYHTFKHHPMTDDDLDVLTAFDINTLGDFIIAYKKFLGIEED